MLTPKKTAPVLHLALFLSLICVPFQTQCRSYSTIKVTSEYSPSWKECFAIAAGTALAAIGAGVIINCLDSVFSPSCEQVLKNCQSDFHRIKNYYKPFLSSSSYALEHHIVRSYPAELYPFIAHKESLENDIYILKNNRDVIHNWIQHLSKKAACDFLSVQEEALFAQLKQLRCAQQTLLVKLEDHVATVKMLDRYFQEEQYRTKQRYLEEKQRRQYEEQKWKHAYERSERELASCERKLRKAYKNKYTYC